MGVKSITKLATLVFCACVGLLFFVSAIQAGLSSCYVCGYYQDASEQCQCRLNPSQEKNECIHWGYFPKPDGRQSKTNHEKDSQEPRQDEVLLCSILLKLDDGSVQLFRSYKYKDPENLEVNITSKCNLDQKLLTANNSLRCYCDTDWCNGQPFDFPDFKPTTTTKLPCPTTTTTTPTSTRKSTAPPGTSTTPCAPNPPTKQTTPQSVTSSAFNHLDDYFTMRNYWILCRTSILVIGSVLLHSGIGHV